VKGSSHITVRHNHLFQKISENMRFSMFLFFYICFVFFQPVNLSHHRCPGGPRGPRCGPALVVMFAIQAQETPQTVSLGT